MKNSFNSDFCITAATVIPLLYITLFLQGQLIQDLAQRVGSRYMSHSKALVDILGRWETRVFQRGDFRSAGLAVGNAYLLTPVLSLILASALAGIAAEALSLWALYYQSDNVVMRAIVLWSTLGLLVLVCASPTITIVRNLYSLDSQAESDKDPISPEDEQPEEHSENPALSP